MSKLHVVVLNGHPENGKDTFREECTKCCKEMGIDVMYRSSIEIPKAILSKYFGWPGEQCKDEKWRKALSALKKFWIDTCDGPTKFLLERIMLFRADCIENHVTQGFFFTDIREASEIAKLTDSCTGLRFLDIDITTVLIKMPSDQKKWNNSSDDDVENYNYDVYVENSKGYSHLLRNEAKTLIERLVTK
jgi:hypothetical protein